MISFPKSSLSASAFSCSVLSVSSGNNLRLPYTGQLIWPVPVMAIAGMLLFAVGWSLRKDKKTE